MAPTEPCSQHHRVSLGIHEEMENNERAKTGKLSRMLGKTYVPSAFKCVQVDLGELVESYGLCLCHIVLLNTWICFNMNICVMIRVLWRKNITEHLLTWVDQCHFYFKYKAFDSLGSHVWEIGSREADEFGNGTCNPDKCVSVGDG